LRSRPEVVVAATDIGKDQERMLVDGPVTSEFFVHGGGQRDDPILMSLAVADEQFVFLALNVVNGQAGIRSGAARSSRSV
jgi:hypothetical protein